MVVILPSLPLKESFKVTELDRLVGLLSAPS